MKVTQEKLPGSQIGLEIEIPAQRSKQVYEKVVQDLARSANIPGFRKGKAPRQVLLQRMGQQRVKSAALEDLVKESVQEAMEQESIEALGQPQLRSSVEELTSQYQPGEPLTISAAVDVSPEVELGEEYKNLSIQAEETTQDPSQVDEHLEQRRAEQATIVPVENRPAQMGDTAVVDYEGKLTGAEGEPQPISGAQATDYELELQQGQFIEEIVEGIVGMKPGETKEIPVSFAEDYPREDLAGKDTTFTVTLKELKEKELPELDDEFAQEVSESETLAELRESLTTQFTESAEQETKSSIQQALTEELLKHAEIDLPETMIEQEVETILTQTAMQMSNYGMDVRQLFTKETIPQMKERSRPEAIQRLKQSLALTEVAKRESLEPTEEEIEAKTNEVKGQLSDQDYDPDRLQELVLDDLRKEKALEWLQEHAQVELVPKGSLDSESEETEETEQASAQTESGEAAAATVDVQAEESS